jgi:hypothetical protein
MVNPNTQPVPHPEFDSPALERRLIKDFYLSFKFSQGNALAQRTMYLALKRHYESSFSTAEKAWLRDSSFELMDNLAMLQAPRSHTRSNHAFDYQPGLSDQFEVQADDFLKVLRVVPAPDLYDPATDLVIADFCGATIGRDLYYQGKERFHNTDDPHSSYLRNYALFSTPTSSDAFDAIFAEVSQAFADSSLPPASTAKLPELAERWEANHPDEHFFPPTA